MNQEYVDTARLLLGIAPAVFRSPRFALKGGTALNLFLHDMPRLSVDIDVVFTDHTLGREGALRTIAADLKAAKSEISALGFRANLSTTKSGDDVKLFVEGDGLQVKVEVNFVFRGTVLPVTQRFSRSHLGPWSSPAEAAPRSWSCPGSYRDSLAATEAGHRSSKPSCCFS